MTRSIWKGFFLDNCLLRISKKKNYFKIWSRRSTITHNLLNKIVYVYNGKNFEKLTIFPSMLGFKLGNFIFTKKRGRFIHVKDKKKKKIKR